MKSQTRNSNWRNSNWTKLDPEEFEDDERFRMLARADCWLRRLASNGFQVDERLH